MSNEDMLASVAVALTQQVKALVTELKEINAFLEKAGPAFPVDPPKEKP